MTSAERILRSVAPAPSATTSPGPSAVNVKTVISLPTMARPAWVSVSRALQEMIAYLIKTEMEVISPGCGSTEGFSACVFISSRLNNTLITPRQDARNSHIKVYKTNPSSIFFSRFSSHQLYSAVTYFIGIIQHFCFLALSQKNCPHAPLKMTCCILFRVTIE